MGTIMVARSISMPNAVFNSCLCDQYFVNHYIVSFLFLKTYLIIGQEWLIHLLMEFEVKYYQFQGKLIELIFGWNYHQRVNRRINFHLLEIIWCLLLILLSYLYFYDFKSNLISLYFLVHFNFVNLFIQLLYYH